VGLPLVGSKKKKAEKERVTLETIADRRIVKMLNPEAQKEIYMSRLGVK